MQCGAVRERGPKSQDFPVKFPVSREFDSESGSLKTASTAMKLLVLRLPGFESFLLRHSANRINGLKRMGAGRERPPGKNIWIDDTNLAVILLYEVSGLPQRFPNRRYESNRGGTIMNIRKLALFAGGAVIVAGGVIYSLGIYPPASWRNAHGAIGQRDVYHAEQPVDASVTPDSAPVAMQADASQLKKGEVVQLQNGQLLRMSNGDFAIRMMNGNLLQLSHAQFSRLSSDQFARMNEGMSAHMQDNQMMKVSPDQFVLRMNGNYFVAHMEDGKFLQLNSGMYVALTSNGFAQRNGQLMQLTPNQLASGFSRQ